MMKLLVATTNKGKLEEIREIFSIGSMEVTLYCLDDFNIKKDCPEEGKTFEENAIQKALCYSKLAPEMYTVADDSGLSVGDLNGAPGVHSARFAGPGAGDDQNTAKLLEQLKDCAHRGAKFVTAVCLARNGEVITTCAGEVKGEILTRKLGEHGFGYDPVFYYPPLEKTFAQLTTKEKNHISHRARAFQQLRVFLESLAGQ